MNFSPVRVMSSTPMLNRHLYEAVEAMQYLRDTGGGDVIARDTALAEDASPGS